MSDDELPEVDIGIGCADEGPNSETASDVETSIASPGRKSGIRKRSHVAVCQLQVMHTIIAGMS